jgi:hypothetical protein
MKGHSNEHQETVRELYQCSADRAVIWISDEDGRIVDDLEVETRIRSGGGGCYLCHEELDGREAHGEVRFDEHGLPRLLPGPGGAICIDCVEWLDAGEPIDFVQDHLGHRNIESSLVYARVSDRRRSKAIVRLERSREIALPA